MKKYCIQLICVSILFLFVFSAVSLQQSILKNDHIVSSSAHYHFPFPLTNFQVNAFSSSAMMSMFHNFGYTICENNDGISSLGLCMEGSIIDHTSSYSKTSLIISVYDTNGNSIDDQVIDFGDNIQLINPIFTNDGYVVCGAIYEQNDSIIKEHPVLIKINKDYEIMWQKEFPSFQNAVLLTVAKTDDDGFIATGLMIGYQGTDQEQNYIILIRTDTNGNLIWKKSIEIEGWLYQRNIIQTADNGFLISGDLHQDISDVTNSDILFVKTDETGAVQWRKTVDYSTYDYVSDLILDSDGVILAGFISNRSGPHRYNGLICCIDDNAEFCWTHYEQFENKSFYGIEKIDEGFILTGYDLNTNTGLLLRIDETKEIKWEMTTSGIGLCNGMDVVKTIDNSYCFTGYTMPEYEGFPKFQYSEMITVCADEQGQKQWEQTFSPNTQLNCEYDKLKWSIQNTGIHAAFNLSLHFNISGKILFGNHHQDEQVDVLLPNEERYVMTPLLFGFGKVTLTFSITGLNIEPTTSSVTGFLIGPFFFEF